MIEAMIGMLAILVFVVVYFYVEDRNAKKDKHAH